MVLTMARKKAEETINLDSILFKCRDILRKARNSGSFFEKRDMMLTLVFLRFIGEKFDDGIEVLRQKLIEQGLDPDNEEIRAAFYDDATFTDGTYNLPVEARWSNIINTPAPQLNVALDTALHSIAASSSQLKGCFIEGTFTTRNLAPNDIKQLVDEVNKITHKAFGVEKDLIGRVYEYFLKEFAVNATKEEGEFYTPHDVVQLIATMIEPFDGTLYDPCCGSGGMFVQSAELVKAKRGDISRINIYGQEKDGATYRLAKMNLALRGISHNLGETYDSSFTHDLHKGLYFNYIMANPPFNLKGWYDSNLANDPRWANYGTPPESNANYAWILHMLSHLKPLDGVAGFLLANGALGDSDTVDIRKKLIQNDKVEAIVVLPRELFITTDISVTLWILNQNKKGGMYERMAEITEELDAANDQLQAMLQEKLTADSIYQLLLVFDQLYGSFTEIEKKKFMQAFIEKIELYPEKQPDGNWLKHITFNFPIPTKGGQVTEYPLESREVLETVMLLSKLSDAKHIDIHVDMNELDVTPAESQTAATYDDIKAYVREHSSLTVSTLYIAQVKRKYGIIERECYNKAKSDDAKQPQCPEDKERAIAEALRFFGMIA